MKKNFLFFLIGFSFSSFAGVGESSVGARSFGLAGNSTQLKDFWGTENNPAVLGYLKNIGIGVSYKNPFLISNLSSRSIALAHPLKNSSFGITINQFGYDAYNENKVGLSYGQLLGKNIAMGIQLNYQKLQLGDVYGNKSTISGNIGLLADISDDVTISAVIINPNRTKLANEEDERYPTSITLGILYNFSKKVQFLNEVTKEIDYSANIKTAIEYHPVKQLYLRAGYASSPSLSTFGFGLQMNNIQFDFAAGFDPNLGFSPQISLSYIPSKNKDE